MRTISTVIVTLLLPLCAYATNVKAIPKHQDLGALKKTIGQFLRTQTIGLPGKVTIEVGSIEPRLKLAACTSPTAFLPRNSRAWGKTTVGIRCDAPSPWTIYVSANIRVHGEYVAAAVPLTRGHVLRQGDLIMVKGELTALPPETLTSQAQALGRKVARSMYPGAPVRQNALRIKRAVRQGQSVRLISTGPGFRISSEGKAQNNAAAGQYVRVKTKSGQIVSGIADAGGIVKVVY